MKKHVATLTVLAATLLLAPAPAHAAVHRADLPTAAEAKTVGLVIQAGSRTRVKTLEVPALRRCQATDLLRAPGHSAAYIPAHDSFMPMAFVQVQETRSVAEAKRAIRRYASFPRRCPALRDSDGSVTRVRTLAPLPGGQQRFALQVRSKEAGSVVTGRIYGFRQGKRVVQVFSVGMDSFTFSRRDDRRLVKLVVDKAF